MEANTGLFLTNYVYQIPVFIVWVIGGVVAIARWRRHPRPSLLVVVALAIFFLRALISPILTYIVAQSNAPIARIGTAYGVINLVSVVVAAVAWSLLLAAALGWREQGEAEGTAR